MRTQSARAQDTMPRIAFAIENHLGHRTVAENLRQAISDRTDIQPVWVPINAYGNGLIDRIPVLRDKHALVLALSARRGLKRAEREGRFDVALLHTQRAAHLLVGWMRRTPTFLSIDATPATLEQYRALDAGAPQTSSRYWVIRDAIHRRTYRAARGVICMSELVRRTIVDTYGVPEERTLVLWPGVDTTRWRPRGQARAPGPLRLLFIGGDFDRKGGRLLLRWAEENKHLPFALDIVTEQTITPPPHVRVHSGLKPNDPRLVELLANADVFVLPTHADMSPWVVSEAKASGKPVLTTTVGALPEMVRDGKDGWLIPPGDFAALDARLKGFVADPSALGDFGLRAREDAEVRFNSQRNAEQLLAFMQRFR